MLEVFTYKFVWTAIICSLVIAGIHAYLGFHIVSRGVIFVDLSLAQMAALGAVFGTLVGIDDHSAWRYALSLGFTFVGAWIVSVARVRGERIPQEAFIGILYAAGAAFTILALARQPGGMEELQHLIAGSILAVTPREIVTITIIYAVIGAVHYALRDRFMLITEDRDTAEARGLRTRWWDFVFYATFAIVVTSAVSIVGVLLVFSFLVIPPVVALLLAHGQARRLVVGWVVALIGSIGGVLASIGLDLPAGPSIIAVLTVLLLLVVLAKQLRRSSARSGAGIR